MVPRSRSRGRGLPPRVPFHPSINPKCQLVFGNRLLASIMMALPFVFCFTLFGIFNLIAGSVLTAMAWKPRNISHQNTVPVESLVKDSLLDPLKIIGPILLITGAMLILVGFALGITACCSVHVQRTCRDQGNYSTIHISSSNGPQSLAATAPWSSAFYRRTHSDTIPEQSPIRSPSTTTRVTIEVHVPPVTTCSLQYRQQDESTGTKDVVVNGASERHHHLVLLKDNKDCVRLNQCASERAVNKCNLHAPSLNNNLNVICETQRTCEHSEPGTSTHLSSTRCSSEYMFKSCSQNSVRWEELFSYSCLQNSQTIQTSRSAQELSPSWKNGSEGRTSSI